jgi:flavin reductase (DIM6/NTAB) family NADH-FMN oxidoreductase RutF
MFFDFSELAPRDVYKLLASVVVPRPIALVTSQNADGLVNAAPYSFFNLVGSDPALVVLGVGNRAEGVGKDTARNIRARGEFVVNLVSRAMAEAMNVCAVDFPPDVSEIESAELELVPSRLVGVPRLKASPVSLECREHSTLEIGRNRLILGEVVGVWIGEDHVDAQKFHVETDSLNLIGRMGGGGGYLTLGERFEMPRLDYAAWLSSTTDSSTSDSQTP